MLRSIPEVFSRAVMESLAFIGKTPGGLIASVLVVLFSAAFVYTRGGAEGMRTALGMLQASLPPLVLVWLAILGWHLLRVPYEAYENRRKESMELSGRVDGLVAELEHKRHSLDSTDPAFNNMQSVIRAFMVYRRTIGQDANGTLLVTSHEDSSRLALEFSSLAVLGIEYR